MSKKIIVNDVEVKVMQYKEVRNLLHNFESVVSEIYRDRKRCFPACTDEDLVDLLKRYSDNIKQMLDGQVKYVKEFLIRE